MTNMYKKCRLCRREKQKLFLKGDRCFSPKCPIEKVGPVAPGMHGLKSGFRLSEYGSQLREKQKTKRYYGIMEKQLKNYLDKAGVISGDQGENLLRLLEFRLDNVVCRLGLASSRRMARQLITHGKILVNGGKVKIPSYNLQPKDKVALSESGAKIKSVEVWLIKKDLEVPGWLKRKGTSGTVEKEPTREEMPQDIKESLIIEFYSR